MPLTEKNSNRMKKLLQNPSERVEFIHNWSKSSDNYVILGNSLDLSHFGANSFMQYASAD